MSRAGAQRPPEQPSKLLLEFADHWRALSGDAWIALAGAADVRRALVEAAISMVGPSTAAPRRVVAWATEDIARLGLAELLGPHGFELDTETDPTGPESADDRMAARRRAAAGADLGITTCAWAAADTGTLALYATPTSGRLTSLLPTVHIALVRPSQIVPTIPDGLALLAGYATRGGGFPSAVNLASGPSRTGDIEGDLAVGAHGPMRAGVIIGDW